MAGDLGGIYRAVCSDNLDPEKRLRIRVVCPQVLGDAPSDWAWPCLPPGWRDNLVKPHADHVFTDNNDGTAAGGNGTETLIHTSTSATGGQVPTHVLIQATPKIGQGVWVMFEGGDPDYPVYMGTF